MYTSHKSQHKHCRYGHKVLRPCNSVTHDRMLITLINTQQPALHSDASLSPMLTRDQSYPVSKMKLKPRKATVTMGRGKCSPAVV